MLAAWQRALLDWGGERLRDLPWRRTRDPWAVLVSEVMAQQTQVARVVPKWHEFLEAYPTPAHCAAAPLAEVLRHWHGLGYPRRARSLQLAATAIAQAGAMPDTLEGLMALPGVGPYTARAVLAFAFEHDAAVVDTNVARVLARVLGTPLSPRAAQRAADEWLPAGRAWAWNQTLMELGATRCRPNPHCEGCPLAPRCAWYSAGARPESDPAVGSAGVSRAQPRWRGSDREARGALMAALARGPVELAGVPAVMGRDDGVAHRLVEDLVREGLCERAARAPEVLVLPGDA